MSAWMKAALLLAIASALGIIAATVVVGSKVREETVVARPYEDGLRHDAERAARAARGLAVALPDAAPRAGGGPLAFGLADREGRPVEGAQVTVELSRPATSRGEIRAEAREVAPGRYEAAVIFPSPGPWDVRFDVRHGADRVRLERRLDAVTACDLGAGACAAPLEGGGEVTLELGPRPLRTMSDLLVRASVREPPRAGAAPRGPPRVEVSFSMAGMDMGPNRVVLAPRGEGLEGRAVLVRCPSGRREWVADVTVVDEGGAARTARFRATVAE